MVHVAWDNSDLRRPSVCAIFFFFVVFLQAALIMQVLSLSDEQIQILPPDQRNSILKLKEQIARNS